MNEKNVVTWGSKFSASENAKNLSEKHLRDRKMTATLLWEVTQAIEASRETFFESILEVHPELEGWEFSYNHKDNTITVFGRKEPEIEK